MGIRPKRELLILAPLLAPLSACSQGAPDGPTGPQPGAAASTDSGVGGNTDAITDGGPGAETGAGDSAVVAACATHSSDHALGPNDVSILVPVPTSATPVITTLAGPPAGSPMVPESLFNELVVTPGDSLDSTLTDYQLVAIRFDLCDRVNPGECPVGQDGRLRLAFQGIAGNPSQGYSLEDVSVHAFYTIPAADLPCVVASFRKLAALADDANTPLGVAPGFSGPNSAAYQALLATILFKYGTADNLQRLTELSSLANLSGGGNSWIFRGYNRAGGSFTTISIPNINATSQTVAEVDQSTYYQLSPFADAPSGFGAALTISAYPGGGPAGAPRLAAGAQVLNPLVTGINSVQCAGCHTVDYVEEANANNDGVSETAIPGWYSSSYPLGLNFQNQSQFRGNLRMFGYISLFNAPSVSQRTVNETAQVLTEIERRYP
jgi:hypothetical protein